MRKYCYWKMTNAKKNIAPRIKTPKKTDRQNHQIINTQQIIYHEREKKKLQKIYCRFRCRKNTHDRKQWNTYKDQKWRLTWLPKTRHKTPSCRVNWYGHNTMTKNKPIYCDRGTTEGLPSDDRKRVNRPLEIPHQD